MYTHRIKGNEPTESNKQKKRIYGSTSCETTSLKKRHDTIKKNPTENANPMIYNSFFLNCYTHAHAIIRELWIGVKCGDNGKLFTQSSIMHWNVLTIYIDF